jgi:sec-independent protein translocase protein TatB
MEVLGVGPLELIFILIIILLVAGPKDIANTARNLGKGLNRLYKSPNYQVIRRASQEIRNLPARLAREAQLEELEELKVAQKELQDAAQSIGDSTKPFQAWVADVSGSTPNPPPKSTAAPPQAPPKGTTAPPQARPNGPAPAAAATETVLPAGEPAVSAPEAPANGEQDSPQS